MSKFDKYNYNIHRNKKPVKIGDYVYIFDAHKLYEAKTVYKVAYYDKETGRVLVEVDPKKNFIDGKYIKGWHDRDIKGIIKKDKLYWWVCLWQQAQNQYILKNE